MLFSIKSQPIDWRPATLLANVLQGYLAEDCPIIWTDLSYSTHVGKSLYWILFLMKLWGKSLNAPQLYWKKPPSRRFTCEYNRTFSGSTGRSSKSSDFFYKIYWLWTTELHLYQDANLSLTFLKIFFLIQLVFGTYSWKYLWWVLFIVKLQSEHCRLVTLPKETPSRTLFWVISKLSQ